MHATPPVDVGPLLPPWDSGDQTQVVRLGNKGLCLLDLTSTRGQHQVSSRDELLNPKVTKSVLYLSHFSLSINRGDNRKGHYLHGHQFKGMEVVWPSGIPELEQTTFGLRWSFPPARSAKKGILKASPARHKRGKELYVS